jgi:ribosomal-protein-alanine N-acetyltransferase
VAEYTIEPMTEDDLDAVLAIEKESFTAPWSRRMFESELRGNPFSRSFVARAHGQPALVGYICYWVVFEELHLLNLAVHPDRRRRGLGAHLVRWALANGEKEGVRLAALEVRASNDSARRLYERLGFVLTVTRPGYYRDPVEDAWIMTLKKS